jgi:hypothetical protein
MQFEAPSRNGVSRTDESTVSSTGDGNEEMRQMCKF